MHRNRSDKLRFLIQRLNLIPLSISLIPLSATLSNVVYFTLPYIMKRLVKSTLTKINFSEPAQ
jgi:hypothetical protein